MGEDCVTAKITDDIKRLETSFEDFKKNNSEVHQKFWEEINKLKLSDAVQDNQYNTIIKQLADLTAEVRSIQEIPKNNWRSVIQTVIASVGTLIVGFLSAQLLK